MTGIAPTSQRLFGEGAPLQVTGLFKLLAWERAYPSDLTDAGWAMMQPLVPAVKAGGRPAIHDRRDIVDAIFYVNRSGCSWRPLPVDFPPWETVYSYFQEWKRRGVYAQINAALRPRVRAAAGRNALPSAGLIDSQSVKTSEKGGSRATAGRRSRGANGI